MCLFRSGLIFAYIYKITEKMKCQIISNERVQMACFMISLVTVVKSG